MKKPFLMLTIVLLASMFIFTGKAFAIDFTIEKSTIDAKLLDNGDVEVVETHLYDFDDDFEGLTRTLYSKEGTDIVDFQATENDQPLEVEREDAMYKIYRSGSYESVQVELTYRIEQGVQVYEDMADFLWPFIDSSGETPYEQMTITIDPPEETQDVIAFGADQSFEKENIQPDGSVVFELGRVPDGTNGDIRVAYPAELFPAANASPESIRDDILASEQEGKDEAIAFQNRQDSLSTFATIFVPIVTLILLILMTSSYLKANRLYKSFDQETERFITIPKQRLSMLATISFTRSHMLPPEAMAAGLLDLVRQGYVKEHETNHFTLIHQEGANKHEQLLIGWLFEQVGDGKSFSLQQLEEFAKDKQNHEKYQNYDQKWKEAIRQEVKDAKLHQNKTAYRLLIGLSSLLLIPLLIVFPMHELWMWFTFTIILFLGYVGYASFYHPRTEEGARIGYEWDQYKREVAKKPVEEMLSWPQDDLMRAVIFGIGTKDKKLLDQNHALSDVFKNQEYASSYAYSFDVSSFILLSVIASSSVQSAHSSAAPSSSSSVGGSPGGGAGGGGGGSGAF